MYGVWNGSKWVEGPFSTLNGVASAWCRHPEHRGDICKMIHGQPAPLSQTEADYLAKISPKMELTDEKDRSPQNT